MHLKKKDKKPNYWHAGVALLLAAVMLASFFPVTRVISDELDESPVEAAFIEEAPAYEEPVQIEVSLFMRLRQGRILSRK